jgi:hypothetical protein
MTVGMIIPFPTEWKVIKFHGSKHFQTTNQYIYIYHSLIIKNSMLEVVPIPWLFSPKTECQARHVMDSFTWGWR